MKSILVKKFSTIQNIIKLNMLFLTIQAIKTQLFAGVHLVFRPNWIPKKFSRGTVFRETVYLKLHAVTVRYSIRKKSSGTVRYGIVLMKAVHGTRRYENFAIPPVSDSNNKYKGKY